MSTRALLLLKQAVKCRLLANIVTSSAVATRLLDLADEYQALALEAERRAKRVPKSNTLH